MVDLLNELNALNNLSDSSKIKQFQKIITAIQAKVNYTPPVADTEPPLSFFKRHPRLKLVLTLLVAGLVVFCDGFVGVATILSGLMTFGLGIFIFSIGFASLLMGLVVLLQLSALSESMQLSWLRPSKSTLLMMQEYKLLNELSTMMADAHFYEHYRTNKITEEEFQALTNMVKTRTQAIHAYAAILKQKNQSKLLLFCKGLTIFVLGLSNGISGFSIGYFFAAALGICFQSLVIPIWVPLILGSVLSLAVLVIFWDTQRESVLRMVERLFGCDKNWIAAMTHDMMPSHCHTFSRLSELHLDDSTIEEPMFRAQLDLHFASERVERLKIELERMEHLKIQKDGLDGQNNLQKRLSGISV